MKTTTKANKVEKRVGTETEGRGLVKKLQGIVVSSKMDKTAVVAITRQVMTTRKKVFLRNSPVR